MPLHMRMAADADIDSIALVARMAFDPATDAIARNIFPEHRKHLRPANPIADDAALAWRITRKGIKMRTERAVLMVVTDDELDNMIVGFALWEEPVPEGYVGDGEKKPPELIPCESLDQEAYKTLRRVVEEAPTKYFGKDGYKHMWYLDCLGVRPDHQRRGIGKILLHWGLRKASEQDKDAFLIATPAGVPLYLVMGFEDLGSFMLFDVPHTCMIKRRPAQ